MNSQVAPIKKQKIIMQMNAKLTVAVLAVIGVVSSAQAVQKRDPIFANPVVYTSSINDPDLIGCLRTQSGSPKAKKDWYDLHHGTLTETRDMAKEVMHQTGTPKSKKDPSLSIAPPR
jgi:hypothetical protein